MGALQQALLMSAGDTGTVVTWNPADKAANIVLSGGDLVAGRTGADIIQSVRATLSRGAGSAGKWYYEALIGGPVGVASGMSCGLALSTASLTNYTGASPVNTSWGFNSNGSTYTNGTQLTTGGAVTWTGGDVLIFGYDATISRVWIGKNGTWLNGGNPAAGTGQRYSVPSGAVLFPMCTITKGAAGETITGRFKAADLTYPVPAGFSAWNA